MIFIHFTPHGLKRMADLQHTFANQTALLVGGSPSLKEQPIELIQQRGVVTMAINNAALHFRPTMWVSGDRPECYDPQILHDGTIMKFAPTHYAHAMLGKIHYAQYPNIYFYEQESDIPWDEYLAPRNGVPWYSNTLFVGIHILYQMGFRRIILAGSDFGFSKNGDMYAHQVKLGNMEKKWNLDLYNSLVRELRMLKPILDKAGLTLMDCSKYSRISQTYKHITMEEAVDLCLEGFPRFQKNPADLPHCSKFAGESIQKRIAQWPGHDLVQSLVPEPVIGPEEPASLTDGAEIQQAL